MKIKPILARLSSAIGCQDLSEQMVLLPEPASSPEPTKSQKSVNLVVGYNRSPSSQTALDLTLWIAHQTRLVTQKQVTVQVVYVLDDSQSRKQTNEWNSELDANIYVESNEACELSSPVALLTETRHQELSSHPRTTLIDPSYISAIFYQNQRFEQADRVLWQARTLAGEWGGSFKAHLRFGDVATELKKVVESEAATLLFLGCDSVNHPIVQQLGADFPCSVLGIPTMLSIREL